MFNTRNKSGISAHPCIILYLLHLARTAAKNVIIHPRATFRRPWDRAVFSIHSFDCMDYKRGAR
jgi:hypothetical protein